MKDFSTYAKMEIQHTKELILQLQKHLEIVEISLKSWNDFQAQINLTTKGERKCLKK